MYTQTCTFYFALSNVALLQVLANAGVPRQHTHLRAGRNPSDEGRPCKHHRCRHHPQPVIVLRSCGHQVTHKHLAQKCRTRLIVYVRAAITTSFVKVCERAVSCSHLGASRLRSQLAVRGRHHMGWVARCGRIGTWSHCAKESGY